jgi:hypothetical protein
VAGGDLDLTHPGVEHGRDEGVAQHMRVRPGDPHASGFGQAPQAAGGGVAVHPRTAGVKENRAGAAGTDGPVDRPPDRWRQRDQDDLGALAAHAQHPAAVLFAEVSDVRTGGFEDRKPSSPSMATSAKSQWFDDSRAVVSSASNCRWVNPRDRRQFGEVRHDQTLHRPASGAKLETYRRGRSGSSYPGVDGA